MLPFEFTLEGPPVSLQTKRKSRLRAWKARVAAAAVARLAVGALPVGTGVEVVITYYHDADRPDLDNIIKPIQDALCGIVYLDDAQVMGTGSRSRELSGAYKIKGASPIIVTAILHGKDFLHVKVTDHVVNQELE